MTGPEHYREVDYRGVNALVAEAPEPVHVVALSGCHTLAAKIRYACEHNRPNPNVAVVRDWLARYHVDAQPAFVADVITAWRTENGPADTGDLPALPVDAPAVRSNTPDGARGFYLAALLCLAVSFDTAWRFFGDVLAITNWERPIMFAVVEVGLIASAFGMRAGVVRTGRPGPARFMAWALCGLAGYMALVLSGPVDGLARVALGPLFGLLFLHHALGIEVRANGYVRTGTWARIGRELRERLLSRLGLSNDARDALARTRDRAARRAAQLSLARFVVFRSARVARAVHTSNVAHDQTARARMLADLAALRHAAELATLNQPSPWQGTRTPTMNTDPPRSLNGAEGRSLNTDSNRSVNGAADFAAPVVDSGPASGRTRRPRSPRNGRTATRKPRQRRRLADYVAEAREHLAPAVVVTPAWVRQVIPGCPHSTSKNVADALNAQLHADAAARDAGDVATDMPGGREHRGEGS